ncbi:hypothetical protein EA462_10750 [Natrarchaeobius halalkaliphilus]|uniref:Uncharacterized protein n=1 Tax=Natrarchaeobius halalkaliphilus TaxID=1679091 RepID=A0A3N6LZW6_9EURY|nr:hypothetical protein EA462_10750 [Natrarchaeobius halalkaliphilus]
MRPWFIIPDGALFKQSEATRSAEKRARMGFESENTQPIEARSCDRGSNPGRCIRPRNGVTKGEPTLWAPMTNEPWF